MMSVHSSHRSSALIKARRPSVVTRAIGALGLYRQRARLAQLDDAALQDIGISRAEAMREAKRPFWDAPDNWRA